MHGGSVSLLRRATWADVGAAGPTGGGGAMDAVRALRPGGGGAVEKGSRSRPAVAATAALGLQWFGRGRQVLLELLSGREFGGNIEVEGRRIAKNGHGSLRAGGMGCRNP